MTIGVDQSCVATTMIMPAIIEAYAHEVAFPTHICRGEIAVTGGLRDMVEQSMKVKDIDR